MSANQIIFVNRFFAPDYSATSQILSDLAFHLARKGEAVSVIASRGLYDDLDAELPGFEQRHGVAIHRVSRPRHGRGALSGRAVDYLTMYRSFAAAARRIGQRGDRLVVKTDPPLLSVALAPVARLKALVLVNWLQDLYPEVALSLGVRALAPAAPLLVAARNASLKAAACNVVIGEQMRRRLQALGVPQDQIDVIPNWSDDEAISPQPVAGNPLRSAWGLEGKFVVGYSGNLGRAHECQTVLAAAQKLQASGAAGAQDIVFLFIGGGFLTPGLKAEAARRGLSDSFCFQPYQDASLLPLSLAVPDVHWISLSASMEGLIVPSKFYGIAAVGRPVIAVSDPCGEIGDLVQRHDCGAAVAPGDGDGLAALICAWRSDPKRRALMGRNARTMLDGAFRKQDALARWERLLASLRASSAAGVDPARAP